MSILCFESGGTKLVAAAADRRGQILERIIEPRKPEQQAMDTLGVLAALGRRLSRHKSFEAIGFGFGGTVRRSDGRPLHCYHEEGWGEIDAVAILEKELGLPVFIENDCNLAALAEAWAVDDGPPGCLLYVTLGTGVGGGVVRSGRLLQLGDAGEAEIGHLVVEPNGVPCPCGNRGCLEMYCSGPGLEQLSESLLGTRLSAPQIMEGFRRSEEPAVRVAERSAELLAAGLAACVNLFAAERVVLGGGVMSGNQPYLELVRSRTMPLVFPPFRTNLREIGLTRCGADVVCRGAALFAIQNLDSDAG